MKILPYKKEHFFDCLHVFLSNVPDYFLAEEENEFIEFLKSNQFPYWIVVENETIVGCGGIYEADENFDRREFDNEVGFAWGMIDKKHHKKGFGKALARKRLNVLIENYTNRPIVLRTTQNTFHFFEKLGFQVFRIEKNGFGPGMDKITMLYKNETF